MLSGGRNLRSRGVAILFCALIFAVPAAAQRFEVEGRYWFADAVNRARINAPQLFTEIDFERDLGLEDRGFFDLAVTVRPTSRQRLRFGFTPFRWRGDSQVVRTIQFGNRTYTVGTRVISRVDLNHARLGWSWQFIEAGEGRFRMGPLVEAHGLWFDAELQAPQFQVRAADKRAVGYPTFGLALDAAPYRALGVFAEASGVSLGGYGYTYNGEAGVRVRPLGFLGISAGYRLFRVDPKFDPDYARIKVTGPFLGASIAF